MLGRAEKGWGFRVKTTRSLRLLPPGEARSVPPSGYVLLVAALVVVATAYGLFSQDPYRFVSDMTVATWRAQDAVTLLTVPLLVFAHRRARAGSLPAHMAMVGLFAWIAYCYAHQAFGVPFTAMFPVYVALLATAGWATLDGLLRVDVVAVSGSFAHAPSRGAFWFLTLASVGVAGLWLSEILPALPGGLPTNIHLAELPNPTWVIDLAWIVPWGLGAAMMLRRRHPAGPVVTGVLLVMLLTLSVAMLAVAPVAWAAGLVADPDVAPQLVVFTIVFVVLGGAEAWLLIRATRRLLPVPAPWLRPGWWT